MIDTQLSVLPEPVESSPRLRLHYLDGLRGLAALVVAFTHTFYQSGWQETQGGWNSYVFDLVRWLSQGRASVAIFIVLSGYCLMLPVVRSADGKLKGGTQEYLKRRMRRILPPYYAALILISGLIYALPSLRQPLNVDWTNALPALTYPAFFSHVFLIQNLSKDWLYKIDPPMWSVATEWQIYFIFPALLLPVWRRFGNWPTILTSFIISCCLILVLHSTRAAPQFVGLFAFGIVAAAYSFSGTNTAQIHRVPWGSIAGFLFACFGFVMAMPMMPMFQFITKSSGSWLLHFLWAIDILVGAATASLLIFCTHSIAANSTTKRPVIVRFFESPVLVTVGTFSYSLYLIHDPLLAITCSYLKQFHLPPLQMFGALAALGLPIALLGSYLFHLAFERRFMGAAKPT